MNFVNFQQFYADIAAWERQLPQFDAICGVPRSGIIPAGYIAVRRNIRLVDLPALLANPKASIENATLRHINPIANKPHGYRILVVDDSTSHGNTLNALRKQLAGADDVEIFYGAVYGASAATGAADFTYRPVPQPRMFEWNWCRHPFIPSVVCDMDGVLCEDFARGMEKDVDEEFVAHTMHAKPLWLPQRKLLAIATSRLERYRPQTEAWLAEHGVNYGALHMHPAPTPEARRSAHDHAQRKAEVYAAYPKAMLFVESEPRQALAIRRLSRRSVLCTADMRMV